MNNKPIDVPGSPTGPVPTVFRRTWHRVRQRILGGLMLVLPILITLWFIHWLYSGLEQSVIDPLAKLILWQVGRRHPDTELPYWFERFAAPLIAILIVLLVLYGLGFVVHSRLRRLIDSIVLRVPGVSVIYDGLRKVLQFMDRQTGQQRQQRMVLVAFPHPGMKVPGFVTGTCQDVHTQKVILCVYVPTTPVPTSGFFLLVPEEETIELNWTAEESIQAIISAGLTAPPQVSYFKTGPTVECNPMARGMGQDGPVPGTIS
ncbi:MAG TPA: DUF502 domain-containing protein [Gemmataceae bacterium]|jgi:uncharacterized membrane protein